MITLRWIVTKVVTCLAGLVLLATAQAQTTINAVYFGQTHVLKAADSYFGLVGNREALIKVHVVNPTTPASPTVTATLTLSGQTTLVLTLTGPATLPASIPDGLGVVQHSFANTFTGYIPAAYVKKGLQIVVRAGTVSTTLTNLDIGAPTKLIMNMTDVQFFSDSNGDYPAGTFEELEAKLPVSSLDLRRIRHVVFPELVIPPRPDVGTKAVRVKSQTDYLNQTGEPFDGEQAASGAWNGALRRAAGRSGGWSLFYLNIYNAGGNTAGGEAGGFSGVGSGTSVGILLHELGHALSLPHAGDSAAYPYKGDMYGISAPNIYNGTHAGPAWAFNLPTRAFIPPKTQTGNAGDKPVGTYKADPMQGGGEGYQEPAYLMNHFSDYSVDKMRTYLHGQVVAWNPTLNSWAKWNQTTGDYTTTVSNNGVQYPTTRDTQVISIMASMSGANPAVNMVYPPIGPYTSGLIQLFDATVAADRTAANTKFNLGSNCDYCVRVVQAGVQKTYIMPASALTSPAQTDTNSLETEAINLPASGGTVTKIELLSTPNVEDVGLPANPTVLYTWAPLTPTTASFSSAPKAYGSSAVTMTATQGALAFGFTGPVEYLFTETTGNTGATSSAWQTSRSFTDIGLQAGTQYSYTVSMRAGAITSTTSAAASATTLASSATETITLDSKQQFNLASGGDFKAVTGLSTFDADGSDKLVVVISTENANNGSTGTIYDVRYNGKLMTEAIQENGGGGNGTAAIFYLDNPGVVGTGIEVSANNPNGGIGCAYALSNTQTGFVNPVSRTGSTVNSVSLTTVGDNSMVIAVLGNEGKPNNSGIPTATSPLTQASSGEWGNEWGGHASGYRIVASPSAITATFSAPPSGGGYTINVAAVEFPALPAVISNFSWTQTAGGAQSWTTASNWANSTLATPVAGSTVNFSAGNITANTTLSLGANRTAQTWKFGDTSGTQNWTVTGNTLTLAGGATPTIQVNNNTTQIDSIVAGTAGLAKTGAGTLILTADNTYSGNTSISGGALRVKNAGALGTTAAGTVVTGTTSASTSNARLELDGDVTVTGEALTISGAGNYLGALTSTSGNNTWTGNVTLGLAGTRIGTSSNASLTVSGVIDSGEITTGLIIRSSDITGIVILSGANTYLGETNLIVGELQLAGGNNRLPVASRLTMGNAANFTEFDLNGRSQEIAGLGINAGATAANNAVNNSSATPATLAINTDTTSPSSFAGILKGNLTLAKTGADTLTLSGNSTYTGATRINDGILQAGVNNALPSTTALFLGSGATVGGLDLNTFNQTIASLNVNSNSSDYNTITIGSGRTLVTNGNVTIGSNSGASHTTNLTVSGTAAGVGSWTVTNSATNGSFQVGGATGGTNTSAVIADLSGLGVFNANLSDASSIFRIGDTASTSTATVTQTLKLAATSTITAGTLGIGDSSGGGGGAVNAKVLSLGTGVNTLNANVINIGETNVAGGQRASGLVNFQHASDGSLVIRSQSGAPNTANLTMVNNGNTGTTVHDAQLLLAGHTVDVSLNNLIMATRTSSGVTGGANALITFDTGSFTALSTTMAARTGTIPSTTNTTGTITIGGGTASLGAVTMAVNTSSSSTTSPGATIANLNINLGAVTATTINMANAGSTGIAKTATANINLTGGSLTLTTGSITRTGGTGTENATITLNGGTLDMGGRNIGNGTATISVLAQSGTLQNIASINGGGGLTKTTAGTLVLSGTNTYTGPTTVSAGTLALGANNVLPATSLSIGSATLSAATFTDTVGTLDVTAAATVQLGSGAALAFANSSAIDWTGGTLTLTGTFVSGSSLRFGTTSSALTATQLALITKPGGGAVALNDSGFLIDAPLSGYAAWAATNAANSTPAQDQDNDGVSNAIEFVLGGSGTANDTSKLPALTTAGGNMNFTFKRVQSSINANTSLAIQVGTNLTTWPSSYNVGINTAASSAGVTVLQGVPAGFDTITLSIPLAPDAQKFTRLNVTITP